VVDDETRAGPEAVRADARLAVAGQHEQIGVGAGGEHLALHVPAS
jgi:hypothetical protein